MPVPITMPQLSDTMSEGTLVKWRKKEGDKIKSSEVYAEVETDKATMEAEAFDAGTLAHIVAREGDKVKVGDTLAWLAVGKEKAADGNGGDANGNGGNGRGGRIFASPLARRIAADKGIDLRQLKGSGPNGRIVQRDVLEFRPSGAGAAGGTRAALPPPIQSGQKQ